MMRESGGATFCLSCNLFFFAAMVDHIMWAMASNDTGTKVVTRVPRLALQIASFLIYAVLIAAAINLVFRQSLPFARLASRIFAAAPVRKGGGGAGGEQGSVLGGVIGGVFGGDD